MPKPEYTYRHVQRKAQVEFRARQAVHAAVSTRSRDLYDLSRAIDRAFGRELERFLQYMDSYADDLLKGKTRSNKDEDRKTCERAAKGIRQTLQTANTLERLATQLEVPVETLHRASMPIAAEPSFLFVMAVWEVLAVLHRLRTLR